MQETVSHPDAVALPVLPTPQPSAGVEAYRRERELALAHTSRRRENWERYLRGRFGGEDIDYLPVKLDIENVSRCNFRCRMCQVSDWPKGRRAADMSLDDFKHLLDEQYGVVEIKLQGMGEPLLQGDAVFDMIRHARSSHIWVRTTTNASLLHLHDNHRKLIDADPNEVQISIDGADRAVFEAIRRGSVFERVVANCRLINAYCDERGVSRTKMWVVVQRDNLHQLSDFVELAAAMGFHDLTFSLTLTDWGQKEWRERNDEILVDGKVSEEACWNLVERGRALGVAVSFWRVTEKYDTRRRETLCPWPFERLYVSSDLRAVPCCTVGTPEASDLGDARELTAAWTGETYRQFRRAHLNGDLPEICHGCYRNGSEPA
ncbi:radical SAM protein [Azospirillum cavernae]|uniref:Radical SAM protein n=1 Tax=Azospirillum cavernae TaxID=2320860 RepID=A0A418VLA2_9PROT|nr:radical SAM protein [Azospirillum cavernae]RJF76866.1 radical SAM protein [Azospirillum cavernae]